MKKNSLLRSCTIFVIILLIISSLSILANVPLAESRDNSNNSPWPCFRQNPQRTGSVDDGSEDIELNEAWNKTLENNVIGSPVITRTGDILQPSGDTLFSINEHGHKNWEYTFDGAVESTPSISEDGTIYIGSADTYLYSLNSAGNLNWRFETESRIDSSPVIGPDGDIYFGNNEGVLYRLNSEGGQEWNISFKGEHEMRMFQSSPAIASDGTIYVASTRLDEQGFLRDGWVHALNPDGTEKWRYERGLGISSSPAIGGNGNVYIGGGDGHLFALDKETGEEVWAYGIAGAVFSSPAIDSDGTIYVGANDNNLHAVNPDGTEKWNFTTDSWIFSSPAVGQDGAIYIGSSDNIIYSINPNGTQRWNYTTDSMILSSPAIGEDGSVYITSYDGTLYAFQSTTRPFEITDIRIMMIIGIIIVVGFASFYYFKPKSQNKKKMGR